jgi:hypothetical protein
LKRTALALVEQTIPTDSFANALALQQLDWLRPPNDTALQGGDIEYPSSDMALQQDDMTLQGVVLAKPAAAMALP